MDGTSLQMITLEDPNTLILLQSIEVVKTEIYTPILGLLLHSDTKTMQDIFNNPMHLLWISGL